MRSTIRPMPSPRGTNHARMFMPAQAPLAAYDETPARRPTRGGLERALEYSKEQGLYDEDRRQFAEMVEKIDREPEAQD